MSKLTIDTEKWCTQATLCKELDIKAQHLNHWIERGKVETKFIPELNLTLVNRYSVPEKYLNVDK
jgi:hypothetical protein